MASLCFFRWPGAYAEAPLLPTTLFDTLLLCITCPGAVGCWAMAGAPANAAKVPITARYLIIGLSFLSAPSVTPAESQGFPPSAVQGDAASAADSVPVAIAISFPPGFQSRAPDRQTGTSRRIFGSMPRQNKGLRPKLDLEAEALAALEEARTMPPGPERNEAMKQAGILRNAADLQGLFFAKRGRPAKP